MTRMSRAGGVLRFGRRRIRIFSEQASSKLLMICSKGRTKIKLSSL